MSAVVVATFFDGRSSRPHPVQVCAGAGLLGIRAGDWERSEPLAGVRVTPRVAGIHRTIALPDGALLQVDDNDAVDAWFPQQQRGSALIDRLERHSAAVAVALLVTAFSLAGLVFFGIPYAAKRVADFIPDSVERAMGEQTIKLLGKFDFDESALPRRQRDELHAVFDKYVADLPDPKRYQLRFMKAGMANAFALPGGVIVMTDEMVRLVSGGSDGAATAPPKGSKDDDEEDKEEAAGGPGCHGHETAANGTPDGAAAGDKDGDGAQPTWTLPDYAGEAASAMTAPADAPADESPIEVPALADLSAPDKRFLAVIAHEIGHEEHKHVLRAVLQNSAVLLVGAYFTGDVSSASALVVSVPTFLLDSHYSRDFESEADEFAFASLAAHGISPAYFAEIMSSLQKARPEPFRHSDGGYLSTHPATVKRIMNANKAAMAFRKEGSGNH